MSKVVWEGLKPESAYEVLVSDLNVSDVVGQPTQRVRARLYKGSFKKSVEAKLIIGMVLGCLWFS